MATAATAAATAATQAANNSTQAIMLLQQTMDNNKSSIKAHDCISAMKNIHGYAPFTGSGGMLEFYNFIQVLTILFGLFPSTNLQACYDGLNTATKIDYESFHAIIIGSVSESIKNILEQAHHVLPAIRCANSVLAGMKCGYRDLFILKTLFGDLKPTAFEELKRNCKVVHISNGTNPDDMLSTIQIAYVRLNKLVPADYTNEMMLNIKDSLPPEYAIVKQMFNTYTNKNGAMTSIEKLHVLVTQIREFYHDTYILPTALNALALKPSLQVEQNLFSGKAFTTAVNKGVAERMANLKRKRPEDAPNHDKFKETCKFCKRTGHKASECFSNPDSVKYRMCANCNKAGHTTEQHKDNFKPFRRGNKTKKK